MFSTGSKLFAGLAVLAALAAVVYGVTQDFGALGGVGLVSVAVALAALAALTLYIRDGEVSAMDDAAARSAAATSGTLSAGLWPLVAALGALILVIGTVTDKRYFVAGLALLVVAAFEWTLEGWAERASADPGYNRSVRSRLAYPLELPVAGAIGLGLVIYGFSRMMLAVPKSAGPAIFVVGAALILVFGILFASRPELRSSLAVAIAAVGLLLVVGGGVTGAVTGERHELAAAAEEQEFAAHNRDCTAPEPTPADKKAGGSVAAKSSPWATLTYDGSTLTARQPGGQPETSILVDRGTVASFMFVNNSDAERRLTIYAGTTEAGADDLYCTRTIAKGDKAWLTFKIAKPSLASTTPYTAYIPGDTGAKVELVVP